VNGPVEFEPFVDASTVAAHLDITRRQVLEMTRRCVIPGYPMGIGSRRRVWRYKLSEIDVCLTTGSRKKSPGAVFCQNEISSKISSGSPPGSQKGKL
jgi:hypothetical protein